MWQDRQDVPGAPLEGVHSRGQNLDSWPHVAAKRGGSSSVTWSEQWVGFRADLGP